MLQTNFNVVSSAKRIFDDDHHLGKYSREKELKLREKLYRWEANEKRTYSIFSSRENFSFSPVKYIMTLSISKRRGIIMLMMMT